ncbi:tape measure protein [Listeria booriae]|uniref:tape measure protein n=1 Tax=Listeria booriae TaxID=1552123 RepID=UPI0016233E1A|nr:tape measure protein [Listeria booriae]MBC1523729.1 tape measure protein [Listeria booriae]
MADGKVVIDIVLDDGSVAKGTANIKKGLLGIGEASKSSAGRIKDIVTSMGLVKVASAAFNVLKGSIGAAVNRFDTMQKFPKVMKALGFSAQDSDKSIKKLSDGIDGLPTTLDEVVASTQQMTSVTGDLDKSTDTVLALNNAFLASGANTDDASRGMQQYNQMLSSGTVDLESWKTLQETMPLALQKTAEAMGYTGKSAQRDLYAALKSGKVTFDDFQNNLIKLGTGTGMLAKLAKENSLGISTSFGNLRNAISKGVANVITKFDELTKKLTGKTIAQNIDGLKGIINSTFESINKTLSSSGFAKGIETIASAIKSGLSVAMPILQKLGTAFADVIKSIIGALPVLAPAIQLVAGVFLSLANVLASTVLPTISKVFQFISANKDVFKAIVVGITAAVAAFKTFQVVSSVIGIVSGFTKTIGLVVFAFNNVRKSASLAKAAMIALNIAFSVNPIILIIGAITALVAGLVWFFTQTKIGQKIVQSAWEIIKSATKVTVDFMITAWNSIVSVLTIIWNWIKTTALTLWDGVVATWNAVVTTITTVWQSVSTFFSNLWTTIQTVATTAWALFTSTIMGIIQPFITIFMAAWSGISAGLSSIWSGIKNIAQGAWTLIKNVILAPVLLLIDLVTGDMEGFKAHLTGIWNNIKGAAIQIWTGIKQVVSGLVQVVVSYAKGVWNGFKQYIITLWNAIKASASAIWNGIKAVVSGLVTGLVNGVKSLWNSLKSTTSSIWNGIKSLASSIWNGIKTTVVNLAKGIIDGAIKKWNDLKEKTKAAFDKVVEFIKHPLEKVNLFEIGKNIVEGLINGISSIAGKVANKVGEIAEGIKKGFAKALKIGSPSRVFDQFGVWTGEGYINGIASMLGNISKISDKMVNAITPDVDKVALTDFIAMPNSGEISKLGAQMDKLMSLQKYKPDLQVSGTNGTLNQVISAVSSKKQQAYDDSYLIEAVKKAGNKPVQVVVSASQIEPLISKAQGKKYNTSDYSLGGGAYV